ncbi:MAG: 3-deoxy-D-manno-octulosonic-acid transferase [Rhodospirillaceae bacterium]|nr:MAG: 3-deoxy-D-manno-octulosonic-acid transferase [Rhodospirillaceae bacterium]
MLAAFAACLVQTEQDRERFSMLGALKVECLGNLKFAADPLPAAPHALAVMQDAFKDRPLWLAASTHAGEEIAAGRLHRRLAPLIPGLVTVIVPRHPPRGAALAAALAGAGLRVARRGAGEPVRLDTEIYLADTLGELGVFFRLAPVVFMGKSLCAPGGGQNPLEPARLGCAIVWGPHMDNFAAIAARMESIGATRSVADEAGLEAALAVLLTDPAPRHAMGAAAKAFAAAEAEILPRLLAWLAPYLDAAVGTHAHP